MKYLILILTTALLFSCSSNTKEIKNYGYTQGTTYSITYINEDGKDYQKSIDSILIAVDKSMSTWVESSLISRINRGEKNVKLDPLFLDVFIRSQQISKITKGKFDITVGPLVNAYGFGEEKKVHIDSILIDSLLPLVGYRKLKLENGTLLKKPHQKISFNAIAQGYSVDLIAAFLESKNIVNYMVEVGGELKTKGLNFKEKIWTIGIDKPTENLDETNRFQVILKLPNRALATSGNYRKYEIDQETGQKFVHTINPKTGYPVQSNLLSASIISENCIDADAFATACMVAGLEESKKLIEMQQGLEGYLVFINNKGELAVWMSEGFEQFIK